MNASASFENVLPPAAWGFQLPSSFESQLLAEARRAPALFALRNLPRVEEVAPPPWAAKQVVTGTKARGYAYERKVGRVLKKICDEKNWKLWDHQWFVYVRGTETKYFQPDFIVERPNEPGIVVEVKLTYVDASLQFNKYKEYLSLYGIECFPVVVARHLHPSVVKELVVDDFNKVQAGSVWHLWV